MKSDAIAGARVVQRRHFSAEFKRSVVEETVVPGVSVAAIALKHRLNANLVFKWRRTHLGRTALQPLKAAKMLPVKLESSSTLVPIIHHTPSPRKLTRGSIEIEYAQAKIRIRGAVDAEALRAVLETLSMR